MNNLFDLKGKTILITGSSRGIGLEIACTLAQYDGNIILHGHKKSTKLDNALKEVLTYTDKCKAYVSDFSKTKDILRFTNLLLKDYKKIDVLILNASMQKKQNWKDIIEKDFDEQINTNLKSSLLLIQQLAPNMIKQKHGRIISIGSINQNKQHPDMVVYSATKSAQMNMIMNFSRQFAKYGITVNNIAPGVIKTDRNTQALSDKKYHKEVLSKIPVGFIGEPKDCVGAALLLSSNAGRYITGQNIFVAGGMDL